MVLGYRVWDYASSGAVLGECFISEKTGISMRSFFPRQDHRFLLYWIHFIKGKIEISSIVATRLPCIFKTFFVADFFYSFRDGRFGGKKALEKSQRRHRTLWDYRIKKTYFWRKEIFNFYNMDKYRWIRFKQSYSFIFHILFGIAGCIQMLFSLA